MRDQIANLYNAPLTPVAATGGVHAERLPNAQKTSII